MTFDLLLQACWFALVLLACWGHARRLFEDLPYLLPTGFCIFAIIFTVLRWINVPMAAAVACFGAFCIAGWAFAIIHLVRGPAERRPIVNCLCAFVAIDTLGFLVPMSDAVDQKHYAMDMAWYFSPGWATNQAVRMSPAAPGLWYGNSLTRPATTILGWTSNLISMSIDPGLVLRLDFVLLVYLGYLVWEYLDAVTTVKRAAIVILAVSGNLIFSLLFLGQLGQAFGSVLLVLLFILVESLPGGRTPSRLVQLALVSCVFVLCYPEMCLLLPFAGAAGLLARTGRTTPRLALTSLGAVALGAGTPLLVRLPLYAGYIRDQVTFGATANSIYVQFSKNVAYYWGIFLAGVENRYVIAVLLILIVSVWVIRFAILDRFGRERLALGILWFAAYSAASAYFVSSAKNPPYVLFKLACWIAPLVPLMLYVTMSGSREDTSRWRTVLERCTVAIFLAIASVSIHTTFLRLAYIRAGERQSSVYRVSEAERIGIKLTADDRSFSGLEWARKLLPYHNQPLGFVEGLKWGEVYSFAAGGSAKAIEISGWSAPEQWHTWTGADRAVLRFPLPPVQADIYLGMACNAYINPPVVQVERILIRANGLPMDDFEARAYFKRITRIPQAVAAGRKSLEVTFLLPNASIAPGDGRKLAMGCNYMVLNQGTPPSLE
jgi:hypothetical protein